MVTHFFKIENLRELRDAVIAWVHRALRFEVASRHLVLAKDVKWWRIWIFFIVLMCVMILRWNFLLIKVWLIIEVVFILDGIFVDMFWFRNLLILNSSIVWLYYGALYISTVVVLSHELLWLKDLLRPFMILFPKVKIKLWVAFLSVPKTPTFIFIYVYSLLSLELICVQPNFSYLSCPH